MSKKVLCVTFQCYGQKNTWNTEREIIPQPRGIRRTPLERNDWKFPCTCISKPPKSFIQSCADAVGGGGGGDTNDEGNGYEKMMLEHILLGGGQENISKRHSESMWTQGNFK